MGLTLLSQRAYAQNTFHITDGNRVLVHTTSATDPEDVLGEAGLMLDADDTYTTHPGDGFSQIRVQRNQSVTIHYYGQVIHTDSFGETVSQLLERLDLSWDEEDHLSSPPDSRTYDGMELVVARVIRQEQTYTSVLPCETVYCTDSSIPEGSRRVLIQGRVGQLLSSVMVTYENGVEIQRTVLDQQVTVHPVNRLVAVGTGEASQQEQTGQMPQIGQGIIKLPTGEVLTYTDSMFAGATAYSCEGYTGITATGTVARVGAIAVDPKVIPYGTRMFIVTNDGQYVYGIATAEDCGSKYHIFGNRIDLYFDTVAECIQFGYRECTIYFLG